MKYKQILEAIYHNNVVSSNLQEVEYNDETQELDVTFMSGSTYRYYEVPEEIYQGLLDAISHGSYFWYNIRNDFSYQRLS